MIWLNTYPSTLLRHMRLPVSSDINSDHSQKSVSLVSITRQVSMTSLPAPDAISVGPLTISSEVHTVINVLC